MSENAPKRHISTAYVVMLSIGMVVGAGIFRSPSAVAEAAGSVGWVYGVWIAGGLLTLAGALCYSELSTAFPNAGGDYHFLGLAYGKRVAFLFAWSRFAIINSGSIAFLGFVIGDYLNVIPEFHLGQDGSAIYAAIAVVLLTLFNLRGAYKGASANYSITGLEVVGLLMLAAAAIWIALNGTAPATPIAPALAPAPASIGLALVFALLAYGGWSEIATLSAEVRDAKRGMVRAHVLSVLAITAMYLLVNWALLRGLGLSGLAQSQAPAADLMAQAFGGVAAMLTAIAVSFAAITSINATIIVGARTTFAAARDYPALGALGRWDEARGIPATATWLQGAMGLALVALGAWTRDGFTTTVDYTFPAFWLFLSMSGIALIILRFTRKDAPRPFKTPLYPLTPIVFVAASLFMLWSSIRYVMSLDNPRLGVIAGILVLGLGLFALFIAETRGRAALKGS